MCSRGFVHERRLSGAGVPIAHASNANAAQAPDPATSGHSAKTRALHVQLRPLRRQCARPAFERPLGSPRRVSAEQARQCLRASSARNSGCSAGHEPHMHLPGIHLSCRDSAFPSVTLLTAVRLPAAPRLWLVNARRAVTCIALQLHIRGSCLVALRIARVGAATSPPCT